MCLQCDTEAENLGEVVPGIVLMRAMKGCNQWEKGWYGLVESNDPFFVFDPWKHTLRPDPMFNWSDEAINASTREQTDIAWQWMEDAEKFREALVLEILEGWRLVEACKKGGYKPESDGCPAMWLFHRLGVLAQNKTQDKIPEDTDRTLGIGGSLQGETIIVTSLLDQQRTFDVHLQKVITEKGLRFVSKQVGRDCGGVYLEVSFANKDNVVKTRRFYVLPEDSDPMTGNMISFIKLSLREEHG